MQQLTSSYKLHTKIAGTKVNANLAANTLAAQLFTGPLQNKLFDPFLLFCLEATGNFTPFPASVLTNVLS